MGMAYKIGRGLPQTCTNTPALRRRRPVQPNASAFAAFQMGMAYKIGRGLPQTCTTAAQWVARAAGEGNTAAQYNLGLRYLDGDGVPVNEDEAVKWLQKAAAQQGVFHKRARVGIGPLLQQVRCSGTSDG